MSYTDQLFEQLEKAVENGLKLIASGNDVDLKGLDEQVSVLCGVVVALAPEEQQQYTSKLQQLLTDLHGLSHMLQQQNHEIVEIKEIPQHRNAAVAYKKADSRDNFGKKEGE